MSNSPAKEPLPEYDLDYGQSRPAGGGLKSAPQPDP